MTRIETVKKVFDYSSDLVVENHWYETQIRHFVVDPIDFDAPQDITTALLPDTKKETHATILVKEDGALAGAQEVTYLCRTRHVNVGWEKKDGEKIRAGEEIASLSGSLQDLMAIERTFLNTLQRMSGIATATAAVIDGIRTGRNLSLPLICATRKTLWGALDKRAVSMGGGGTHRLGLWDGILIKDNHIDSAGGVKRLVKILHATSLRDTVQLREIEAASPQQAQEIMEAGLPLNAIMLDNFSPEHIEATLVWAREKGYYDTYIFEASGGITQDNIAEYASTGVDVISLGALTHSAKALDISMNIV